MRQGSDDDVIRAVSMSGETTQPRAKRTVLAQKIIPPGLKIADGGDFDTISCLSPPLRVTGDSAAKPRR